MAFEPFGYRFELRSPLPPAAACAAIRNKKKSWFDPQSGARGWIAGPVLCLWNSAFNQYGPMAIAWIDSDGMGTRIVGRAGSDLNGTVMVALLAPFLALLFALMLANGGVSPMGALVTVVVLVIVIPLTLWMNHRDRRDADPLVQFLRRALSPAKQFPARQPAPRAVPAGVPAARLLIEGEPSPEPPSAEVLCDALCGLANGGFLVLERDPQTYMQILSRPGDYVVEKREGSADRHYGAEVPKGEIGEHSRYDAAVARVAGLLTDYLEGRPPAYDLDWKQVRL